MNYFGGIFTRTLSGGVSLVGKHKCGALEITEGKTGQILQNRLSRDVDYTTPTIIPESLGLCMAIRRISPAPAAASIPMICSWE